MREAFDNFMIGNPENRKVNRWGYCSVDTYWMEEVKIETITRSWNKIVFNVEDIAIV